MSGAAASAARLQTDQQLDVALRLEQPLCVVPQVFHGIISRNKRLESRSRVPIEHGDLHGAAGTSSWLPSLSPTTRSFSPPGVFLTLPQWLACLIGAAV